MEIPPEVAKYYPPMPTISDKKRFTHGNPPPGPAHAVGTSYTALCVLGEDATRPFGPAHVRAACFLNFVFIFSFLFRFRFFSTLNNLGLQKSF